MMAIELPAHKESFLIREVPGYFPVKISLMTIYRWIESGELEVVGPKFHQRVTRDSLQKKLSQF